MWVMAPRRKRNRNTAVMGSSRDLVGTPPRLAKGGGKGAWAGPWGPPAGGWVGEWVDMLCYCVSRRS